MMKVIRFGSRAVPPRGCNRLTTLELFLLILKRTQGKDNAFMPQSLARTAVPSLHVEFFTIPQSELPLAGIVKEPHGALIFSISKDAT